MTRVGLAFVAAMLCTSAQSQPPPAASPAVEVAPAFEVASVKRHPLKPGQFMFRVPKPGGIPFEITGNRVVEQFASVEQLVMDAYGVKDYQVSGLPDWGRNKAEIYDIDARTGGDKPATVEQVRLMLQSLLADRFQLKLHRESKDLPVYELVIGKGGAKLVAKLSDETPGRSNTAGARPPAPATLTGSLASLLTLLSNGVDRPIVDKTGLTESYYEYANLDWVQFARDRRAAADNASLGESIFTAVQEKLGLKLQPTKAPTSVLVIDHVDRPSEN